MKKAMFSSDQDALVSNRDGSGPAGRLYQASAVAKARAEASATDRTERPTGDVRNENMQNGDW